MFPYHPALFFNLFARTDRSIYHSATAGVARRTAVAVKTIKDWDYSYLASEIYMWALVEMMFGFIVFCTPSIPLAFKHIGVFALVGKVRSWGSSGLLYRKKSSVPLTAQEEWPLPNTLDYMSAARKRQNAPLRYDKYGMPLTDMSGATQVDSVEDMTQVLDGAHETKPTVIFRTTEVETRFTSRQEGQYGHQVPALGTPHLLHYGRDSDNNV